MGMICFLIATIVFAIKLFDGQIADIDMTTLGLFFVSLGLLLGGGAVAWVRKQTQ